MTKNQTLNSKEIALLKKLNLDPKDSNLKEKIENILESNPQPSADPLEGVNPLNNIKILDPAGGSGAFPNQVHSYLAKKTADLENQEAIEGGLESLAY